MGPTRIGDYEIRHDDEETLQYEVVETISGNLLATFQTEPEARTYATKLDVAQQATKPMTTLRLWPRDILKSQTTHVVRAPQMWSPDHVLWYSDLTHVFSCIIIVIIELDCDPAAQNPPPRRV